jgi:N-acetylglutamate synthase-like GNAT family acetyltransferase
MDEAAGAADPNAVAAEVAGIDPSAKRQRDAAVDPAHCVFRRARPSDIPRMAEMMIAENLPPLFIDEWLPGFVVVDHEGDVVGCGGAEIYDGSCVIRSVAVDPRARRSGLARRITDLLVADARAAGAVDAYLFTVDAYPFWLRMGFADVPLDDWKLPPRQGWQYTFIAAYPEAVEGVHSMWKSIG